MKKILFLFVSTLLLANLFVSTGCGEDDTVIDNNIPPLVTVSLSSADTIAPGENIVYSVTADKGTDPLASMTIKEGGTNVDAARITIENISVANNPQLITDADKEGLVYNITITGSDTEGDYTYETSITDDGGLSDSDVFTVTVMVPVPVGTPITGDLSGILLNQAGPSGTGGLDLDAGTSTGSADPIAELRDWGIDTALPNASNWRRQIGASTENSNGTGAQKANVRFYDSITNPDIIFDDVNTTEAIADTWSKADPLTNNRSDVVIVGDIFAVENVATGRLYLIRIDEVNEVTTSNADNYVISIKY